MCLHSNIHINELFSRSGNCYYTAFINDLVCDSDSKLKFIGPDCTDECKTKMIQIVKIIFEQRKNDFCWYYHDTISGSDDSDPNSYFTIMRFNIGRPEDYPQYNFTPQLDENGNFPPYPY